MDGALSGDGSKGRFDLTGVGKIKQRLIITFFVWKPADQIQLDLLLSAL